MTSNAELARAYVNLIRLAVEKDRQSVRNGQLSDVLQSQLVATLKAIAVHLECSCSSNAAMGAVCDEICTALKIELPFSDLLEAARLDLPESVQPALEKLLRELD